MIMNDKIIDSAEQMIHDIDLLRGAGHGVIFVRTSEPDRASRIIDNAIDAFGNAGNGLASYKITTGPYKFSQDNQQKPSTLLMSGKVVNGKQGVVGDLKLVLDEFETNANDSKAPFYGYNYLSALNVEVFLEQKTNPAYMLMHQKLIDLHTQLPAMKLPDGEEGGKRLFCIIPTGYVVSDSLQCIPMVVLDRPTHAEHSDNLIHIFDGYGGPKPNYSAADFEMIATNAMGLTESGATAAIAGVIYSQSVDLVSLPATEFAHLVGLNKTDMINKSPVLEVLKPVPIDQVGGLEVLKSDAHILARCMTPEAAEQGIDAPKGWLLAGMAGTGKTLFAQAVASILNVPLIKFNITGVLGGIVGSSESNMAEAMAIIKSVGKAIIIIDECEKFFGSNGTNDGGVSKRILGIILSEMQDNKQGTFYIMTANRPWELPAELTRRGRIDELYAVGAPTYIERDAIFRIHLKMRGLEVPDSLEQCVTASKHYMPSEIEYAVVNAMRSAFVATNDSTVTDEQLAESIKRIVPQTTVYKDQSKEMSDWVDNNARAASLPEKIVATRSRPKKEGGRPKAIIG